jgi:hypothetical protein
MNESPKVIQVQEIEEPKEKLHLTKLDSQTRRDVRSCKGCNACQYEYKNRCKETHLIYDPLFLEGDLDTPEQPLESLGFRLDPINPRAMTHILHPIQSRAIHALFVEAKE